MHDIDSTRLETSPDQNEYQEYQEFAPETATRASPALKCP